MRITLRSYAPSGHEIWLAIAVADDDFSIDDRRVGGKRDQAVADGWKTSGVVVASSRENGNLVPGLVQLSTKTVELNLVKPLIALRRLALQDRKRKFDEGITFEHKT
jgi:hypothetical protein